MSDAALGPNLVRVQARRRLLELVAARVAGVDGLSVLYRLPPNHPGRKVIAGGDVEGEVSVPTMRAGRKARLDSFDLTVWCLAGPGSVELDLSDPLDPYGYESLDRAVLELVQVVDDVLAEDPRLEGLAGWVATLAAIEGPNAGPTQQGPESAAAVTVHFEIRHRGGTP